MNDLHFENQLLQAEVVALRSELTEATERHGKELEKYAALSRRLGELQPFKARAVTLEKENRRLNLELTQLKKDHVEIEILRDYIVRLEDERNTLKKTDAQMKIVRLNEVIADQVKIVEDFARKFQRERAENERLKIDVSSLSSRLSSSYLDWQRVKWKILSFTFGLCLLISMFTSVWLFIR